MHGPPTGHGLEPDLDRAARFANPLEVVVVADHAHRPADGRIDHSVRELCGTETGRDRVGEERAGGHRRAGPGVQGDDLAVEPEPAVGAVDLIEDPFDRAPGGAEVSIVDDKSRAGTEGPPGRGRGVVRSVGHEAPVVACVVPVDVVGAAVAWADVVVELDVVLDVVVVDAEVVVEVPTRAVVVTSLDVPSYDAAATAPNAPTAATPAIVVPMVIFRSRPTARSRSSGVRRVALFMVRTMPHRSFPDDDSGAGVIQPSQFTARLRR